VAEFAYQPVACQRAYRVVVVRKNLSVEKGERVLFDDVRYFFYITNLRDLAAAEIVLLANDRCDQENLIAQLKGGVQALKMPVDNLVSNWAYMVMAALAWSLKAWLALALPETPGRWQETHAQQKQQLLRMEFKPSWRRPDPPALPDHQDQPADRLPPVGLESLAGGVPAAGRNAAPPHAPLTPA
jgi:hypothetical protein